MSEHTSQHLLDQHHEALGAVIANLRSEIADLKAAAKTQSDLVERLQAELFKANWGGEEELYARWVAKDAEIERLRAEAGRLTAALKQVGDDYPGSSCQAWCYKQAGLASPEPGDGE